jgi:hypothetical protein
VRVEVSYTDLEGNDKSGDTSYELDASGFGAGCNPDTPPRFEHPKPKPEDAAPSGHEPAVVPPPDGADYAK